MGKSGLGWRITTGVVIILDQGLKAATEMHLLIDFYAGACRDNLN